MAINQAYIAAFLARVEGKRQTHGYIPCHKAGGGTANYRGDGDPAAYKAMGVSGVTIATGCDLGQTSAAILSRWGLANSILAKFSPYLGKRKGEAIAILHQRRLTISDTEAIATDLAVHSGYLRDNVIPVYEKAAGVAFADLPDQAQAVIMSCIFHKGPAGVRKDWPVLWGHLIRQDWKCAAQELLTGFRQYRGRRQAEGRLLLEIA